ncbi:hypothetical protein CCACVL1_02567 [Corchorus capsularis]|uniref:Uncharacterized protein n=1 Tax=Corchorus capsularis TaxID=210143 RepID=A0A1R3K7M9_COCAP|nr:hypothetical protein CCACVL1_02567 [Corchorus capsularis]
MDHDGQRGLSTPSAMLASLLSKRAKLQEELRIIERQVYDMETSYLQDPSQCGNVLKGFEGFLSASKNTAFLKRSRKFQPEDRLFSLSSVTSPAAEEIAAGRDEKSDYGPGRSRGGGYFANGQGKPKKGRAREAKRMRTSSEPDYDYDDDPDEKLKMQRKKEPVEEKEEVPVYWLETTDAVTRRYEFETNGYLSVKVVNDSRPVYHRVVESFLNKFFPSGYPYSVNEGYLRYTQFRALQHLTSAALSVLSTQSLLFAAGLRPTPAQATAVSWILKDGMQHMGKLICSNLGARMDSEPKRWRILADVLYDLGTGLEVLSPLCPHLFLEVAGLGNFAKGMAVVAARATRLPIYSSFAKEGNLSDLFAKGEAISTLFNVVGIGVGIQLASTVCSSMQGKLVVGPLLSVIHVYSVVEEMRAAPVNTLNPQRTAMIVADFLKTGKVSSPADLRYREDLLFPGRLIEDAGNVKVGRALHKVVKPSKLLEWKEIFPEEKFVLSRGNKWTDMLLEHNASGEDALRGWLVAAYAASTEKSFHEPSTSVLQDAYEKMNSIFTPFLSELRSKGWHTDRFLDGTGSRFAF